MRREEARAIYSLIKKCNLPKGAVILNIGSSTHLFRTETQPHINQELFAPLNRDGYAVKHVDIKSSPGVDIVGDVLDKSFQQMLTNIRADLVLCSNLLEHLTDRPAFIEGIKEIVSERGYLLVTVPNSYPYHGDPIDTLYRPAPEELAREFQPWESVRMETITSDNFWKDLVRSGEPIQNLLRLLLSIMFAMRSPKKFFQRADRLRWLFKKYKVSVVLLRA